MHAGALVHLDMISQYSYFKNKEKQAWLIYLLVQEVQGFAILE
jgi:hypothetical protein